MTETKSEKIARLKRELAEAEAMPNVGLVEGEYYLFWNLGSKFKKMGIFNGYDIDGNHLFKSSLNTDQSYSEVGWCYEPLPRRKLGWKLKLNAEGSIFLFNSKGEQLSYFNKLETEVKDFCTFAGIRVEDITEEGVEI